MFSPLALTVVIVCYMAFLFAVAHMVERQIEVRGKSFQNPWIYALSLAVYHTSWTFYGSVGFAIESGLLYLGIYVGAIIGIMLWGITLKRMVAVKETFRITSIADFISTRYNRSQKIAATVTLIALIGIMPYISLQLKAVVSTIQILTEGDTHDNWGMTGILIIILMISFTIMFGARRLDPTERHQGMIVVLVVECIVKLIAFLAVGYFVTEYWLNGFGNVMNMISANGLDHLVSPNTHDYSPSLWLTFIVLSFSAIQFLPRQFHVAVVENSHRKHIRTALWVFPLYIIAINLFVVPVAAAGLMSGLPIDQADYFILLLPQSVDNTALTLLVFLGGFSAATGMIIITTITMATMTTNHLLLPVIENIKPLNNLRTNLLQLRWLSVFIVLGCSYLFAVEFSNSYILAAIGLLSFVAALQFAPPILLGMFWRKGNSAGAFAGLVAGFVIWLYTLLLPTVIKNGWLDPQIMTDGPWQLLFLRPEALFGIDGMHPITHATLWSLLFNVGCYLIGSLIYHPGKAERNLTQEFRSAMLSGSDKHSARPTGLDAYIPLAEKISEAETLLSAYLAPDKAVSSVRRIARDLQVHRKTQITIIELMEFHRMLEHVLAGSLGSASAHNAMETSICYTEKESADLKALYSHIVTELHGQPRATNGNRTEQDVTNGNFTLLDELQDQIDLLQKQVAQRDQEVKKLEQKLEHRFDEIFRYRVESQKLKQENENLRKAFNQRLEERTESPEEGDSV